MPQRFGPRSGSQGWPIALRTIGFRSGQQTSQQFACVVPDDLHPQTQHDEGRKAQEDHAPGLAQGTKQLLGVTEGEIQQHGDDEQRPMRAREIENRASFSATPTVMAAAIEPAPRLMGNVSG